MNSPTYHGYPQHPDAHPERPWWRTVGDAWIRTDLGRVAPSVTRPWAAKHAAKDIAATDALLAAYDREHPLPVPRRLCGQVWVWGGRGRMITDDGEDCGGMMLAWPQPDAVLVAGPLSPWAPSDGITKRAPNLEPR